VTPHLNLTINYPPYGQYPNKVRDIKSRSRIAAGYGTLRMNKRCFYYMDHPWAGTQMDLSIPEVKKIELVGYQREQHEKLYPLL